MKLKLKLAKAAISPANTSKSSLLSRQEITSALSIVFSGKLLSKIHSNLGGSGNVENESHE